MNLPVISYTPNKCIYNTYIWVLCKYSVKELLEVPSNLFHWSCWSEDSSKFPLLKVSHCIEYSIVHEHRIPSYLPTTLCMGQWSFVEQCSKILTAYSTNQTKVKQHTHVTCTCHACNTRNTQGKTQRHAMVIRMHRSVCTSDIST